MFLSLTGVVKQAIAWQQFIPFYKFFGRQDRQFDSPGGALALHWIFQVLLILVIPSGSSAYYFWRDISAWGYTVFMGTYAKVTATA
jgi:Amino acid permease